eukprot:3114102-Prorocentrum_lima.AAC.1
MNSAPLSAVNPAEPKMPPTFSEARSIEPEGTGGLGGGNSLGKCTSGTPTWTTEPRVTDEQ